MIGKIVLNNVVVLTDILLDHVTESVSDAAGELSRRAARRPRPPARRGRRRLAERLPAAAADSGTLADASRELVAELLLALSEATSDEILTDERRADPCAL